MKPAEKQEPIRSFSDLLHEAPTILDLLPPESRKNLSATCRSFRTSFCAGVKVISLSEPADASKICCTTWPRLVMVVASPCCKKLNSNLSSEWDYMMEVSVSRSFHSSYCKTALLLRSGQQRLGPLTDMPAQHRAALSDFAHKHRQSAQRITLQGPLANYRVFQALRQNAWPKLQSLEILPSKLPQVEYGSIPHLSDLPVPSTVHNITQNCTFDASTVPDPASQCPQLWSISLAKINLGRDILALKDWPNLEQLELTFGSSNATGSPYLFHQLVSCSLPSLQVLILQDAGFDMLALHGLSQGQWPLLQSLCLYGNYFNARGIPFLVEGSWPMLRSLTLSEEGLDEHAYSLLGIAAADIPVAIPCHDLDDVKRLGCICAPPWSAAGRWSSLPQFPFLKIQVFEH